jgi:CMP-N,N'-diacetyllegionaminic acid synthase
MKKVVAIIPARGGSKGIPLKNLHEVCGKPLIAWSIIQAVQSNVVDEVFVSSDNISILECANYYGAKTVLRPPELSGDLSSSDSAWLHAINAIESNGVEISSVIGIQATSPIRGAMDISNAFERFIKYQFDSLLSVVEIEDFFIWQKNIDGFAEPMNYDHRLRKPRQLIEEKYLENGSFYIFQKEKFMIHRNRLFGKIGYYEMDKYKMFQIDSPSDIKLCEVIMRGYDIVKSYTE